MDEQEYTSFDSPTSSEGEEAQIDPFKFENFMRQMESEQNLALGIIGGLMGAIIGACLWAIITVITSYQIGWMAIGVGFLVGFAVRFLGRGLSPSFGIVGGLFSFLGCIVGNFLSIIGFVAQEFNTSFLDAFTFLIANPSLIGAVMGESFSMIDLLFYGFAIYTGYKYSFREIKEEEMKKLMANSPY